jgi:hypothetical protein
MTKVVELVEVGVKQQPVLEKSFGNPRDTVEL